MNQKGFTVIEALVLVAVFMLVGAVGYSIYKTHTETSPTTTNKSTNTSKTTIDNTSFPAYPVSYQVPSGWAKYSNSQQHITISYPPNWKFSEDSSDGFDVNFYTDSKANVTNSAEPNSFDISAYKGNLRQTVSRVEDNLIDSPPQLYGEDTEELSIASRVNYTFEGKKAVLINSVGKGVPGTPGEGYITYYQDFLVASNSSVYDFSVSGSDAQGQGSTDPINESTIKSALGSLEL